MGRGARAKLMAMAMVKAGAMGEVGRGRSDPTSGFDGAAACSGGAGELI